MFCRQLAALFFYPPSKRKSEKLNQVANKLHILRFKEMLAQSMYIFVEKKYTRQDSKNSFLNLRKYLLILKCDAQANWLIW